MVEDLKLFQGRKRVFLKQFLKRKTKLQNNGPLIYISLNNKSAYCFVLRSSKDI